MINHKLHVPKLLFSCFFFFICTLFNFHISLSGFNRPRAENKRQNPLQNTVALNCLLEVTYFATDRKWRLSYSYLVLWHFMVQIVFLGILLKKDTHLAVDLNHLCL